MTANPTPNANEALLVNELEFIRIIAMTPTTCIADQAPSSNDSLSIPSNAYRIAPKNAKKLTNVRSTNSLAGDLRTTKNRKRWVAPIASRTFAIVSARISVGGMSRALF